MTETEVLGIFRETNALLDGHFLLRSGLHSRQYFQCTLVLQYPSNYTDISGPMIIAGIGDTATNYVDPGAAGGSNRFYRVRETDTP